MNCLNVRIQFSFHITEIVFQFESICHSIKSLFLTFDSLFNFTVEYNSELEFTFTIGNTEMHEITRKSLEIMSEHLCFWADIVVYWFDPARYNVSCVNPISPEGSIYNRRVGKHRINTNKNGNTDRKHFENNDHTFSQNFFKSGFSYMSGGSVDFWNVNCSNF